MGDMSRSDASSSRLQIYGSLKGKGDDTLGHHNPPLPDLSAFLSQEELDESVNLARQAIGHHPSEERSVVEASVTPATTSNVPPSTSGEWFSSHSPVPFAPPSAAQTSSEVPVVHSNRKVHTASTQEDNMIRNNTEGLNHRNSPSKSAPYGLETQSKKEFLNKAADFIEELSSLFKANSSKRVRPRSCKAHRSRVQNKTMSEETTYPLSSDSRERAVLPPEAETDRPDPPVPPVTHHPVAQQDAGSELREFQDCGLTREERIDFVSQEEGDRAQRTQQTEPACGPPHFIQRLKSREVPEGSKVRLDCIVQGHPAPEVR